MWPSTWPVRACALATVGASSVVDVAIATAVLQGTDERDAATAATRYKVLRILYGWLEEERIDANPMAREMSVAEIAKVTAAVPEMPVEVFVHGAGGTWSP